MSTCNCIKELLNNEIIKNDFSHIVKSVFPKACLDIYALENNIKTVNNTQPIDNFSKNWIVGYYDKNNEYQTTSSLYKWEADAFILKYTR